MCHRSSGVVGRRVMLPEPSLAEMFRLRSFMMYVMQAKFCPGPGAKSSQLS